jgi:peptidylprolyl isomerase
VRAVAVAGLAARRAVRSATPALLEAVAREDDPRVAVELVRALGGASATDATRAALVPYLQKTALDWGAGKLPAPFAHVVLEGLRQQAERAGEPAVRAMYLAIAKDYAATPASGRAADRQRAGAWASCLALAALARPIATTTTGADLDTPAVAMSQLERCGGDLVGEASVRGLALDAIAAGPAADAVKKIMPYARHPDQRIATAAIGVLPAVWKKAGAAEKLTIRDALAAALARPEPAVAGAAAAAAGELIASDGAGGDLAPVAAAVVNRLASAMAQPELLGSLLDVVGKGKLDAAPICQQLRTHVNPTLRAAARTCVTALFGDDPGPAAPVGAAPTPPVDPLVGLDRARRWRLLTTQGELVIALAPTLAPWHVASIDNLTRSNFYDGLPFHRVVADFVVQGGDPTGTGWGGPDYTLPTETGSLLDEHPGYRVGGVGIADAGKDTGGSQWFAMIGRAPHLDGRYSWIGVVVEGQDVVDRLQIGDLVLRARIE